MIAPFNAEMNAIHALIFPCGFTGFLRYVR